MIPWTLAVTMVRSFSGGAAPVAEARLVLTDFKATGRRPRYGWLRFGLPAERTGQPETWGPNSPTQIDWTGF